MLRFASLICAFAAAGMLAWAGYSGSRAPSHGNEPVLKEGDTGVVSHDGSGLVVENAEQELGDQTVGEHPVTVRLTNPSGRLAEIVGYPNRCGAGVCLSFRDQGRIPIPPGGTIEVTGDLTVSRPGPFEFEGELFLRENGLLRPVHLKLTGVGVSGGKPNAPSKP